MKREPERMCVACRERHPKSTLNRYVLRDTGEERPGLEPDPQQVLPGRGYYICNNEKCAERFKRFKGFGKKKS